MIVGIGRKFGSIGGNDSFTKLLLHGDGSDGSTTIIDSSASAHSVSTSGNAQIDTAQSKFGGASCLFDGTTDYLVAVDSADWNYAGADFTIDLWARFASLPGSGATFAFLCQGPGSGNQVQFEIVNSSGTYWLRFFAITGGVGRGTFHAVLSTPSAGTWYHFAVERSSSTVNFYQDGTKLTTVIDTAWGSVGDLASSLTVGADNAGTAALNGWLDEIRLSKGIGRYGGSSFTPNAGPYG